ncbi:MAG: DEAD/DEAH box helicase [Planctomycetota bacterium]|nr:MAG: DEAD/DEAH box helicase [Planctomycetota bacterium]
MAKKKNKPSTAYDPRNPLIVQGDGTLLLETGTEMAPEARDRIGCFAELRKSPEHMHTYLITPLSIWNALASDFNVDFMVETLQQFSKNPVPRKVIRSLTSTAARYGKLRLEKRGDELLLVGGRKLLSELLELDQLKEHVLGKRDRGRIAIAPASRGLVKQLLIKEGYPVKDLAGYDSGAGLQIELRDETRAGLELKLRPYQITSIERFHEGGATSGGSGVVVLPCGAGKTLVGMGVIALLKCQTLVVTTNNTAVAQWGRELLDKTTLSKNDIGEYTGETKCVRPVTLTTYQMLTYRARRSQDYTHLALFTDKHWGLIIYDEVHLLPAPVFRLVADIQAKRRLGLTATLVREDGRESDVFSLIGPIKFYRPWKVLERQGFIATAICCEVRVPLSDEDSVEYDNSEKRAKHRIASENFGKVRVLKRLLELHKGDQVLIIGQYLRQIGEIADEIDAPLITGDTPNAEREHLYGAFKEGEIKTLVVSKVGNFAIDLPDANVLIQVSGTYGSRQEEAQRLGRILRPKKNGQPAIFYTLVTQGTRDQDFAKNRQLYLAEQGYSYAIIEESEIRAEGVRFPSPPAP